MAIELLTPGQLDDMRPAGRFVAEVLTTLVETAEVGTDLLDLDALAHRMIKDRGDEAAGGPHVVELTGSQELDRHAASLRSCLSA